MNNNTDIYFVVSTSIQVKCHFPDKSFLPEARPHIGEIIMHSRKIDKKLLLVKLMLFLIDDNKLI